MFCRIAFTVFFRRDHFERLIVPEHGENNVADFVHYGSDSNHLFLTATFADVIIVNDGVYRHFCCFIHFQVVYGDHMQDTPGKAGPPLGHMYPVPVELAGIIYTWVQPKVSIELPGGGEQVKGSHFRNQDNGA